MLRRFGWFPVAAILLLPVVEIAHARPAEEPLNIRLYDVVGVPAPELACGRQIAGRILMDAGVRAVWVDCSSGCHNPAAGSEVMVRLVAAPEAAGDQTLGWSLIDPHAKTGTLATVYADRVSLIADRTGVDPAVVLGRAIAHEIGHLLMGTDSHAPSGLMRAEWHDGELQRNVPSDWTWRPEDVRALRRGLFARMHTATDTTVRVER